MSSASTPRSMIAPTACIAPPRSSLCPRLDRGAANRLQTCAACDNRGKRRAGDRGAVSDTIEFQLLGATEARRDGEPVPLSGARRRALVARLLLDADRVVRADALIEDVWDGSPRPAAMATLQSHISQLRKVLGDRLQSQAAGYVLRTDAVIVDAAEFERQAEAGAAQLSASDAAAAHDAPRRARAVARPGLAGRRRAAVGAARSGAPRGVARRHDRASAGRSARGRRARRRRRGRRIGGRRSAAPRTALGRADAGPVPQRPPGRCPAAPIGACERCSPTSWGSTRHRRWPSSRRRSCSTTRR